MTAAQKACHLKHLIGQQGYWYKEETLQLLSDIRHGILVHKQSTTQLDEKHMHSL